MRYGTVIQYFPGKGFGFIKPDFGPDVFFHVTAIGGCEPAPEIKPGQAVKYELVPGTEPKRKRRRPRDEDDEAAASEPARPQAKFVELIERIPGGALEPPPKPATHPKARRKKPTWRR
jgi:cold shock CspA family protein